MRTDPSDEVERWSEWADEERFDHTLRVAVASEKLWGLHASRGLVLYEDPEGGAVLPLWPRSELAAAAAQGPWSDGVPEEIELRDFLEHWVTGLSRDHRRIVVCPDADGRGLLLAPEELGDELLARLRGGPTSDE